MHVKLHILLAFCLFVTGLTAQTIPNLEENVADSIEKTNLGDSLVLSDNILVDSLDLDSLALIMDSLSIEEIARRNDEISASSADITYSKDSLDAKVDYEAQDSMIYDIAAEEIHLYGNASVKYQDINLEADYIIFRWSDNTVTAQGMPDSSGTMAGYPKFSEKEQSFDAKKMRYNFLTKKGIIYNATTTHNDMYILGDRAKFTSKGADSLAVDDHVYSSNAIFTTCNHPEPHFGIRSRKQKVVPNKTVVVGPSNLEIAGIPTPVWLPFGFFPISDGASTGLIFPKDFEYSQAWGFGLEQVGWYFPINDRFDLTVTGDIYFLGTHRLRTISNYKKRYRYNGNIALEYSGLRSEQPDASILYNRSFSINWRHTQDAKAHPTNSFSASLNFQTNNHQSANYSDAASVLNQQLSSNVSFRKRFPGKPYSLSISGSHSQNTSTRDVTIDLPRVNFDVSTIFPFKNKKKTGKETWYDIISMSYNFEARNEIRAKDTTLFQQQTLDDARYGARHKVNMGASYNLLKFFKLSPSVDYTEAWYFKTLEKTFDDELLYTVDSVFNAQDKFERLDTTNIQYGTQIEEINNGMRAMRQFNTSIRLSTTLFGTMQFKKGWFRGLRHTVNPSIGFSYTPDYTAESLEYFKYVRKDTRNDETDRYSVFQNGIYGTPSSAGKSMAMTYSISSNLESKFYSKRDSSAKKVKLLKSWNLSGNYNFAADSLNFSTIGMNARTDFFNGITNLGFTATFDPYTLNDEGQRISTLQWDVNKKPLRFSNANFDIRNSLRVTQIKDIIKKSRGSGNSSSSDSGRNDNGGGEERRDNNNKFTDFFDNLSVDHNFKIRREKNHLRDTSFVSAHSITLRGSLELSDHWRFNIGSVGYDFINNSITYPTISLYRDLHCWEMDFTWSPSRSTYTFGIRVKPSTLGFIDVPYKKNIPDGFRF